MYSRRISVKNIIIIVSISIISIFLVGFIISKRPLVSPVPEDTGIKIIIETPVPTRGDTRVSK